jgi:hypothetical protein
MDIDRLCQHARARTSALIVAGLLLCGVSFGAVSIGSAASWAGVSPRRSGHDSSASTSVHKAKAATVEAVNFKLTFEITAIKGNVIEAKGFISSSKYSGAASLYLDLVNASRATASFNSSNSRGKLSGSGTSTYRVSGAVSYFKGSNPIVHGSGKYEGAKALGISMSGTMNRRTLEIKINLQGRISVKG